jgi:hypothetical protein
MLVLFSEKGRLFRRLRPDAAHHRRPLRQQASRPADQSVSAAISALTFFRRHCGSGATSQ